MGRRRTYVGGKTFGRLKVSAAWRRNPDGRVEWFCKCSCGGEIWVRPDSLKSGHTRSCGRCVRFDSSAPAEELGA